MTLNQLLLETKFNDFINYLHLKGEVFIDFEHCKHFQKNEGYKKEIFKEARNEITYARWEPKDIGSGKIHFTLVKAIKNKVIYNYDETENNLINHWTLKDDFAKFKPTRAFEQLMFEFYKDKGVKKEFVFEELLKYRHPYNLIAYLFFIKDCEVFLPISQRRFDAIFLKLGINDFKTDGNASWENYTTFLNIIKQVRVFLRTKDKATTLLDAHSFLWLLGDEMKKDGFEPNKKKNNQSNTTIIPIDEPIDITPIPFISDEDDERSFLEGKEKYRIHIFKERNSELVKTVKEKQLIVDERLCCKVCGFSFIGIYGELGQGFIEAHHLYPISNLTVETITKVEDLVLVCSNCHRMLHRKRPWITVEKLKTLLK